MHVCVKVCFYCGRLLLLLIKLNSVYIIMEIFKLPASICFCYSALMFKQLFIDIDIFCLSFSSEPLRLGQNHRLKWLSKLNKRKDPRQAKYSKVLCW